MCTAFHSAVVSVNEQMLMKRPKRVFSFIPNIILCVKLLSLLLLWAKIMLALLIQKYLKPLNFIHFEGSCVEEIKDRLKFITDGPLLQKVTL